MEILLGVRRWRRIHRGDIVNVKPYGDGKVLRVERNSHHVSAIVRFFEDLEERRVKALHEIRKLTRSRAMAGAKRGAGRGKAPLPPRIRALYNELSSGGHPSSCADR